MLDKNKIIKELQNIVLSIFTNLDKELRLLHFCFDLLIKNKSDDFNKFNLIFAEPIDTIINLTAYKDSYAILAVDGSQIYPDKHQGMTCHVINIGWVKIVYNSKQFFTEFKSEPTVFNNIHAQERSEEIVDCQRTELEFKAGLSQSIDFKNKFKDIPFLLLFDGSLINWNLENKSPEIKSRYLNSYFALLDEFYREKILMASFISMPKNRDLINFINYCIANKIIPDLSASSLPEINLRSAWGASQDSHIPNFEKDCRFQFDFFKFVFDGDLISIFLKPLTRSAIIGYNILSSSIISEYPAHLRPHFVYLNMAHEIVRVEFPAWIAKDILNLNLILDIIVDQCIKGCGYPVVLAEAHEQAVIKNSDREFFYQMLYKISTDQNRNFKYSRKSLKKKMVAV